MTRLTEEQLKFLKDSVKGTWTQNSNGEIDVIGHVEFCELNLKSIPVQFGSVSGFFDCYDNKLNSLKGCAHSVNGYFNCSENMLTSLEFCPSTVSEDFYCSNNLLTSLEFCPSELNGDLDCHSNKITSVEFLPTFINGEFDCRFNVLSEKTIQLIFKSISEENLSIEMSIAKNFYKISKKDLKTMKISKDFQEKYKGAIAALNLGLI